MILAITASTPAVRATSPGLWATPTTYIQKKSAGAISDPEAVALDSVPTEGNTLFAFITAYKSSGGFPKTLTVTQAGVTWTRTLTAVHTAQNLDITLWVGVVGAGASVDISIDYINSPGGHACTFAEFAGAWTLDTSGIVQDTLGGASGWSYGTASPGQAYGQELWLCGLGQIGDRTPYSTYTGGVTELDQKKYSSAISLDTAFKFISQADPAPTAGVTSTGNGYGGSIIACFRRTSAPTSYSATLSCLYDDGTTLASLATTVTDANGQASVTVTSSPAIYYFNALPSQWTWTVGTAFSRNHYLETNGETAIFIKQVVGATVALYQFNIKDYSNILTADSYLEFNKVVSGTSRLVGSQIIKNTLNGVPLAWSYGSVYEVVIRVGSTDYSQGYIQAGDDYSVNILLKAFTFTQTAQLSYKYVLVEATRPSSTQIVFAWNNTLTPTYNITSGLITVKYRNGTQATNSTISAESGSFTWNSAVNVTDYKVLTEIVHEYLGAVNYEKVLSGSEASASDFPSLDALGSLGAVPMGSLLAVGSLFIIGGSVSFASVPLGAFSMVALAGFYAYRGVMTFSDTFIWTLIGLVALIFLASRRGG
jgi:hypothetical protein